MSTGLRAVCRRELRGFGWFDAAYRFAAQPILQPQKDVWSAAK